MGSLFDSVSMRTKHAGSVGKASVDPKKPSLLIVCSLGRGCGVA